MSDTRNVPLSGDTITSICSILRDGIDNLESKREKLESEESGITNLLQEEIRDHIKYLEGFL